MKNELLKIVVVSALSIGVLGGAFVGVNYITLANGSQNAKDIEPVTIEFNPDKLQGIEEVTFDLVVLETPFLEGISEDEVEKTFKGYSFDKPENILSAEEAAQFGARYIEEVLGESIEGQFVAMSFFETDAHTGVYWQGRVGNSKEAIDNRDHELEFIINAMTGERIRLKNLIADTKSSSIEKGEHFSSMNLSESEWQTISDFAQRHFNKSEIFQIRFISASSSDGIQWIANFNVLDDRGHVARLEVLAEVQELVSISSFDNDRIDFEPEKADRLPGPDTRPVKEFTLSSGETILLVDDTAIVAQTNPHLSIEITPEDLTMEEAVEIAAQYIYEEFGKSVEGMRFEKSFWFINQGMRRGWQGAVLDESGEQLYFYLIDARTGRVLDFGDLSQFEG